MTMSYGQLGWLTALALIIGVAGSAWIARHQRGVRAGVSYLLMTAVPYVGVTVLIADTIDPTLSSQQAQYDGQLAFALFVIAFTLPWILAGILGRWLGRRGSAASVRPSMPTARSVASDNDLPDWHHADDPRLNLAQLNAHIRDMARCLGFAAERLPECGSPRNGEGQFIDVEKFDYVYGYFERGQLSNSHRSAVANEICYRVFYDLAFADAMNWRSRNPDPALPFLAQLHRELDAILRRIDPRWAAQAVHERAVRATTSA